MQHASTSLFSSSPKETRIRTPFEFDKVQNAARKALSETLNDKNSNYELKDSGKTGWLPGPLSYPWIFIAVGISDLVHTFFSL